MMGLLDTWWVFLRDFVGANPALIWVILVMFMIAGLILKRTNPEFSSTFNTWVRIARYCSNCPYVDLHTQACKIDAATGDTCAVIDKTDGKAFEVTRQS